MLNEVKHLGLEKDLCQVVGVRFFAALRMTSIIYSSQNYTFINVSQVVHIVDYCPPLAKTKLPAV